MITKEYPVLGMMSGTSLDGLDLAFCRFRLTPEGWEYQIDAAETVPYTAEWADRLAGLDAATAMELALAHAEYGRLTGRFAREFLAKNALDPLFIASHGHTVFHRPDRGVTTQIGDGATLAAETGKPVICDFRTLDVALGGQGAPLVPIGDELLFARFDYCLNLGGFANLSGHLDGARRAWDICPVNIVLNRAARRIGMDFDRNGAVAASGQVDRSLLSGLNALPFYSKPGPKSLGKEWVNETILPLLEAHPLSVPDLLATLTEHAASRIGQSLAGTSRSSVLVTGGGAFNRHLIERIGNYTPVNLVIPDPMTVNFKEALVFAFLGLLRFRGEINCLRSVTGAIRDSSGGAMYGCFTHEL